MNSYRCIAVRYHVDAQILLCIARHKTSWEQALVAHQYTALLTLPGLDMPPMEANNTFQGCLPSYELHRHDSRSLTVRRHSMKVRRYRLHMQITRSWDCACLLCNFRICATQFRDCTYCQIARNIYFEPCLVAACLSCVKKFCDLQSVCKPYCLSEN